VTARGPLSPRGTVRHRSLSTHALGSLVKQGRVTASRVSGLRGLRYVVVEDGEGRQQLTEEHA
jgi:hypothetical protein